MLKKDRIDVYLLFIVLCLVGIGTLMVYSLQAVGGNGLYYLKRHLTWVGIGTVAMALAMKMDIERMKKMAYPAFLLSLALLVLVFIPGIGVKVNGARRWLNLGGLGFQPSELVKLSLVIAMARFLSETERQGWTIRRFFIPITVIVAVQVVLLLQPDFGGAMIIGGIGLLMLFVAGSPLRYFLPLIVILATSGMVLVLYVPYRFKRIMGFLNPWKNPMKEGFQLIQSLVGLGRGGLTGVGIGNSQQKLQFLPEAKTDFIFSIIGEEMGLIGVFLVVTLFVLLLWRGYKTLLCCSGLFSRYLAFGLLMTIEAQALINMAVVTGLLPTKGLPLPFISYGGSAMVSNMTAVGILLWLSKGITEISYSERHQVLQSIKRRKLRREGLL